MNNPPKKNDFKEPVRDYIKYTGLGFQMIAILCIFAFIGNWADHHFKNDTPWITALSCIIGVCLSLYQVIRQLK